MKHPTQDKGFSGRARKPAPVGGKALARLRLFAESRGLALGARSSGEGKSEGRKRPAALGARQPMVVAVQAYLNAAQALAAAAKAPARARGDAAQPTWQPLGPTSILHGQTYGCDAIVGEDTTHRGTVSGRVAAVAVDPKNSRHILAGAAGGGVWESQDHGATWAPRTDTMPTLTIGAIAFDPAKTAVVYAGTGEGNCYSTLGMGVLKSNDGGTTWSVLTSEPFLGEGFFGLLVEPGAKPAHLLAATTNGLWQSSDGGRTWAQRLSGVCWSLSASPSWNEVLAAGASGFFSSFDQGTTWNPVSLPGAPANWERLAVAHSPSSPAVAYVFGAGDPAILAPGSAGAAKTMPTPYLWQRATNWAWYAIGTPPDLDTSQSWYDWFLAVAPDNCNQVYLGAIDAYWGDFSSGSAWSGWKISAKCGGDSIHPDQHAIAIDPADPNIIYVGCDGGLFRSPDRGFKWEDLNSGLGITEIEYMAQDTKATNWILSGTQDNGTIRYTGSPAWEQVAEGDGGECGVNRSDPKVVFHSFFDMGLERSVARGARGTFTSIGPTVPDSYQALFYPPVGCCDRVIAQAGQSVFLSRDNGDHWAEVALPAGAMASVLHAPTPDHLYVGCTNGGIFRIDGSAGAWLAAAAIAAPRIGAWISDLQVDPGNLRRVWATSSDISDPDGGRVFRSDDGGASWVDCTAGLPALPINGVEVDATNPKRVWVSADLGVYQSLDAGATWKPFSRGLPNALVEDMLFHPVARVLRAATRSRGVWEIAVGG